MFSAVAPKSIVARKFTALDTSFEKLDKTSNAELNAGVNAVPNVPAKFVADDCKMSILCEVVSCSSPNPSTSNFACRIVSLLNACFFS